MARIAKWLGGLLVACTIGWLGWWFAGAAGQEAALEGWLADRAAEGWQAEGDVEIAGFPLRFERRIEAPALADPEAGWAWSAPWIEAGSEAWDPTHIALGLPGEQLFAMPGQRASILSERFGGVMAVVPGLSLALRELSLDIAALRLEGKSGWQAGAEGLTARIARRREGAPENTYDVDLSALGVRLPARLLGQLGLSGEGRLTVEGQMVTDRPVDRALIETGVIGARTLVLRQGRLALGAAVIAARGRLDADAAGFAEGELRIEAENWRALLDGLVTAGAVHPRAADAVRQALSLVSLFGDPDRLDITLGFSGGAVRIGPISLGDAPRLMPPTG